MNKIIKIANSLYYFIKYKFLYFNKIKIHFINVINGKLSIIIKNKSEINIGKKLCIDGPLYLKCINGGKIKIGEHCYFNHNCSITSLKKIEIGNHCMFGNNIVIVDHNHLRNNSANCESEFINEEIIIGDNVWIGANCTILKGVLVDDGSVIAANSVVNKNIPKNELWGGCPAKFIKKL